MNIAIRADAGSHIGMGHIMRTLVLAEELSKENNVFYICRKSNDKPEKYQAGIDMVKSKGFKVITIDEKKIMSELISIELDCLITDSYDIDQKYFEMTKKYFKYTGYIDDMNLYYFDVDFLINQNIGSEDYNYKCKNDSKKLLGIKYLMLREEFRASNKINIRKKISDILITVGGGDDNNITGQLCSYLKELDYNFHIVIGPSFKKKYINQLEQIERDRKNIKLYINPNMIDVMKKCDLSISACGSTLYELASCGIPTLGIIVAENQRQIAITMDSLNVIKSLGDINNLTSDILCNEIRKIDFDVDRRISMNTRALSLIDGKGVQRISGIVNKLLI